MKEANAIRSEKRKQLGLPQYTLMEEILNSVTHGLGAALAAVGLVLLLLKTHGTIPRLSILFYCISAVALYTNSAIYHGAKVGRAKTYLRVVDHCTIFLLIAGTYTPFLFITLHDTKLLSAGIFLGVTATAIAGIVLNIIDLKRFAKISMVFYLLMGWLIAGASYLLIKKLPANALILLVAGGLLYSIGAILYGLGKKIPYIHTIWHLFVLGGSVLHYLAVYLYVV